MCTLIADERKVLPKSSKGTIQRGIAYEVFREDIEALYTIYDGATSSAKRTLAEIEHLITHMVVSVAISPGKLDLDVDLFSWGVDSLMATRIRAAMLKVC